MDPQIEYYKAVLSKQSSGFKIPVFKTPPGTNMARGSVMFSAECGGF